VPRKSKNRGVNTTKRVETFARSPRRGAGVYASEKRREIVGAVSGIAPVGKPGTGIGNRTYPPCVTGVPSTVRPIIASHDARSWYTPSEKEE
jgi:hypothetical protein